MGLYSKLGELQRRIKQTINEAKWKHYVNAWKKPEKMMGEEWPQTHCDARDMRKLH